MRVTYDISTLGIGHRLPRARGGIYRVVENIACELLDAKECELSFCASQSYTTLIDTLDFLAGRPDLARVPFISSGVGPIKRNRRLRGNGSKASKVLPIATLYLEYGFRTLDEKGVFGDRPRAPFNPLDLRAMAGQQIFHSPFHPLPAHLKKVPGLRKFLTIHDLIPILFPQYFQFKEDRLIRQIIQSLSPGDWVLCNSESTKNDLCNFTATVDPAKVAVTPWAASDMFYPCRDEELMAAARRKYSLPDAPYLLSLSTLEPRKNIAHTVRCFARVVQEQKIADLHLVLVGTKGWDYDQIFESIADVADVKERIIATGYAADEDLAAIYSGALAFVIPSHYEGFGLPPLEAMQCGVPVITSNTSSLPEVVGDAGIMVDPTDVEALCQAMLMIYENEELRREMQAKSLQRARLFSWEKTVQQTVAAYKASL